MSLKEALAIRPPPRRRSTWFDRLPASSQAELNEVKVAWLAGEYCETITSFSNRLREHCLAAGLDVASPKGIREWLRS